MFNKGSLATVRPKIQKHYKNMLPLIHDLKIFWQNSVRKFSAPFPSVSMCFARFLGPAARIFAIFEEQASECAYKLHVKTRAI